MKKEALYDMHIHSTYSDGQATYKDVIEVAIKKNIGVCITDHNHITGSIKGKELAQNKNVDFICGMELGTKEGKELLLYFKTPGDAEQFYIKEVEPFKTNRMTRINRGMLDFVCDYDIKKEYNIMFSSLPHPYGILYKNVDNLPQISREIIRFVDAIEVINLTMGKNKNAKALKLAIRENKFQTASTDAHLISSIGKVYTNILFDKDETILSTHIIDMLDEKESFGTLCKTLLHITKCNINHSILKRK